MHADLGYWHWRPGIKGTMSIESGVQLWMKKGWGQATVRVSVVFPSMFWHWQLDGRIDTQPVENTVILIPRDNSSGIDGVGGRTGASYTRFIWKNDR